MPGKAIVNRTAERTSELELFIKNIRVAVQDYKGTMKEHLMIQKGIDEIVKELFPAEEKE